MIALSEERCKGLNFPVAQPAEGRDGLPSGIHGNVSRIILLPHFRPSPAPLPCEKRILR
jgi:hypothetical protein